MSAPDASAPREPPPAFLETREETAFQRRQWLAERAGWAAMATLLCLFALGVFGSGPIGVSVAGGGPLRLEYDRFLRHETQTELRFLVAPVAGGDRFAILLSRAYLDRVRLESVDPQPERVEVGATATRFVFAAAGDTPLPVRLSVRPSSPGQMSGQARLEGASAALEFGQFVYP